MTLSLSEENEKIEQTPVLCFQRGTTKEKRKFAGIKRIKHYTTGLLSKHERAGREWGLFVSPNEAGGTGGPTPPQSFPEGGKE